jgi:uncharacterized membrane protein
MIRVEESVIINRPLDEVFAFVADQTNAPKWQTGLVDVQRLTDRPLGIGTRHRFVRTFMGRKVEGSNEFTEYEPNRKVVFRNATGSTNFKGEYMVEPDGDGTRLTSIVEIWSSGVLNLAEPLMKRGFQRDVETNLTDLKVLLESRSQVAGSRNR